MASSQICLASLAVQRPRFPRAPKTAKQAKQLIKLQAQDPKTSQDNPARPSRGCEKLDYDCGGTANDDDGCRPHQSTHRLRIFTHRPRWPMADGARQGVNGASVENKETGPRWSTDLKSWVSRVALVAAPTASHWCPGLPATSSSRSSVTVLLLTGRRDSACSVVYGGLD